MIAEMEPGGWNKQKPVARKPGKKLRLEEIGATDGNAWRWRSE